MRNLLMLLVLSFLFVSNINAQKIKLGLVAGSAMTSTNKQSNHFTYSGPDTIKNHSNGVKNNFSFFGGVVAAIPIGKNFIFRPQLQYIGKGWTINHDYEYQEDFTTKLVSHWVELPLNFVYAVPAKNGRFFFGLGPQFSYALSAKIHDDRESGSRKVEFGEGIRQDGIPNANRIDVGMNLITSYEFRNGFFISLNYSRGFIDFRNDLDEDNNPQNKNIVVGLGIGYMFK